MIEETGRVVDVRGRYAWIATEPRTACNSCSVRNGCGTSVLAKVLGRRNAPLRVINSIGVVAGDRVVIGVSESGLVRGSLAVYCVPLAGLFAGGVASHYLFAGIASVSADLASIPAALAGFAAGLVWLRSFSRKSAQDARYQPVLLRQLLATGD
jgi:sigma-E factor negative regulatory protein RseC